jgi:hypothetical protein
MDESLTTIGPIPENIIKWGNCLLLHTKTPIWDGDYQKDERTGKMIRNIRWICKICDKDKENG